MIHFFPEPNGILGVDPGGIVLLQTNLLDVTIEPFSIYLTVKVSDNGLPSLSNTTVVEIRIKPPVIKPPVFEASDCDDGIEIEEVIYFVCEY